MAVKGIKDSVFFRAAWVLSLVGLQTHVTLASLSKHLILAKTVKPDANYIRNHLWHLKTPCLFLSLASSLSQQTYIRPTTRTGKVKICLSPLRGRTWCLAKGPQSRQIWWDSGAWLLSEEGHTCQLYGPHLAQQPHSSSTSMYCNFTLANQIEQRGRSPYRDELKDRQDGGTAGLQKKRLQVVIYRKREK